MAVRACREFHLWACRLAVLCLLPCLMALAVFFCGGERTGAVKGAWVSVGEEIHASYIYYGARVIGV